MRLISNDLAGLNRTVADREAIGENGNRIQKRKMAGRANSKGTEGVARHLHQAFSKGEGAA